VTDYLTSAERARGRGGLLTRIIQMSFAALLLVTVIGCGDGGVGKDGDIVGGPCTAGGCAGGSTCRVATMYPGGTCVVDCASQSDCPDGTACVQESGGVCLLACTDATDCRDGYSCTELSAEPAGRARVCIR